jgi:GH43 family beta-xylosidase
MAEMENPFTVKSPRIKIASPEEAWETGGELDLLEGPEILKNNNKLIIVYSCRESWLTHYRLGMLVLKGSEMDPMDPGSWQKKGPVFEGPLGVGHCSFVKSPDGTEDWIVYHSKRSAEPGWQREVRTQPFAWDENGLPDFGKPFATEAKIKRPAGEYETELKLMEQNEKH